MKKTTLESVAEYDAAAEKQYGLTQASEVEIVTAASYTTAHLASIAENIEHSIDLIRGHQDALNESTLEHRVEIGWRIAQAKQVFTIAEPGKRNASGKNQHTKEAMSAGDMASKSTVGGFSGWLHSALPHLKRPTADLYAAAFSALELPLDTKPAAIRAAIQKRRYQADKDGLSRPSVKSLAKLAPKPELELLPPPPDSPQLRLEDAREAVSRWQDAWDTIVSSGQLDDLDRPGLESLKSFQLTVRDRINARLK